MTNQGTVICQWRQQNETRGRLDRRLSVVDVQGERSLNPRWHEMSMPAAMDSQLLLVVKVTTTDSELTQYTYPIPEDRGEWQDLASIIMNEAHSIGSTGDVSFIGLLFRPGWHHGETGTGEATTMMQTVDSLARSLGLPGGREIEEVKHCNCPLSSHSV